jgi:hypothetical protein
MRLVAFLLVPVLAFCGWQMLRQEQNERRLALVATELAQRDVGVDCPTFFARLVEITPNAGWVDFDEHGRPSHETSLSATTCRGLERVWRRDQTSFTCLIGGGCDQNTVRAVYGIVTLAHESWHLRGVVDEGQTQCYAIQTTERVALRLGVSPEDARLIALRVAADDAASLRGEYHSAECRPGGAFDLHRNTRDWPDRPA